MKRFALFLICLFAQLSYAENHVYDCRTSCTLHQYVLSIDTVKRAASVIVWDHTPMCNVRATVPFAQDDVAIYFTPTRAMLYLWMLNDDGRVDQGVYFYRHKAALPLGALQGQSSFTQGEMGDVAFRHRDLSVCSFHECNLKKFSTSAGKETYLNKVSEKGCVGHSPSEIPTRL